MRRMMTIKVAAVSQVWQRLLLYYYSYWEEQIALNDNDMLSYYHLLPW
jgi:hypothetical protein